jgi:hypothetical protein
MEFALALCQKSFAKQEKSFAKPANELIKKNC